MYKRGERKRTGSLSLGALLDLEGSEVEPSTLRGALLLGSSFLALGPNDQAHGGATGTNGGPIEMEEGGEGDEGKMGFR